MLSAKEDVDLAVSAAKEAYPKWAAVPVPNRMRLLYNYLQLIQGNGFKF